MAEKSFIWPTSLQSNELLLLVLTLELTRIQIRVLSFTSYSHFPAKEVLAQLLHILVFLMTVVCKVKCISKPLRTDSLMVRMSFDIFQHVKLSSCINLLQAECVKPKLELAISNI